MPEYTPIPDSLVARMVEEARDTYRSDKARGVSRRFSDYARNTLKRHGFEPSNHKDVVSAINSIFGTRGATVANQMRKDGRLPARASNTQRSSSAAPPTPARFREWLFPLKVSTH